MSDKDWDIPAYILDGDNCSDDYLNNYKNPIDMLNGLLRAQIENHKLMHLRRLLA